MYLISLIALGALSIGSLWYRLKGNCTIIPSTILNDNIEAINKVINQIKTTQNQWLKEKKQYNNNPLTTLHKEILIKVIYQSIYDMDETIIFITQLINNTVDNIKSYQKLEVNSDITHKTKVELVTWLGFNIVNANNIVLSLDDLITKLIKILMLIKIDPDKNWSEIIELFKTLDVTITNKVIKEYERIKKELVELTINNNSQTNNNWNTTNWFLPLLITINNNIVLSENVSNIYIKEACNCIQQIVEINKELCLQIYQLEKQIIEITNNNIINEYHISLDNCLELLISFKSRISTLLKIDSTILLSPFLSN